MMRITRSKQKQRGEESGNMPETIKKKVNEMAKSRIERGFQFDRKLKPKKRKSNESLAFEARISKIKRNLTKVIQKFHYIVDVFSTLILFAGI